MATSIQKKPPLIDQVTMPAELPGGAGEAVWIEVIQCMDSIYTDLVQNQIELEEKNEALEDAYRQLNQTHDELKNAQQQLVQSEKMASLGRLVAGVAHELNNPISFILGNTHALESYNGRLQSFFTELNQLGDPKIARLRENDRIDHILEDLVPLVDGTKEGAERVSNIVQSLLRFTTPQQEDAKAFDLCQLVKTATQWVLRGNRRKSEVHFDLPQHLTFMGHEGLTHQILVNLIQNAVDAMESEKNPTLWISLRQEKEAVFIEVQDNGAGISPDHLANIFDPFFTTKTPGKGTGLGLYISYLLATEHCQGNLTVENHLDTGALFVLSLPLIGEGKT